MEYDVKSIFNNFQIEGKFLKAYPYGSGHINDTFAVKATDRRYIFQRINHNIFKDPPKLMNNIARVTEHIRKKMETQNTENIDREVLTVIPASDGNSYYIDNNDNYWRAYVFIENVKTYDVLENLDQAYQAAKAFGNFQKMLVDLPEPPLFETIPDFHNGPKRFRDFQKALKDDKLNRAISAKDQIKFLNDHSHILDVVPKLIDEGKIPVRITHNDTKINNVMIDDDTNEGVCVIDLDTVMPGSALYDYGDIVRTTVSSAQEDEADLSKIFVEMDRFESFTRGYLTSAGDFLNDYEKKYLVHSGQMITLIIGTRFLTDYIQGDIYFKTHKQGHNLQRCKAQFKRVISLIEHQDKLNDMIEKIDNSGK